MRLLHVERQNEIQTSELQKATFVWFFVTLEYFYSILINMNSEDSFLKKMETDLTTGNNLPEDHRGIFHREKVAPIRESWDVAATSKSHDDLYDDLEIKRIQQKSLFKKMFIGACVFALIAVGAFAFSLFTGRARLTGENVVVSVQTKTFADSGEEINVKVSVANENPLPMELVKLTFKYPVGSTKDENAVKEMTRDLGTIGSGQVRDETFTITLFGEQGIEKNLSAVVEYRLQDSNAVYEKNGSGKLTLRSSVANLVVSGSPTLLSGQQLPISLDISGNATNTVKNALLVADYPDGCNYVSSETPPTLDKNIWFIGDIEPGVQKKLPITVSCSGNTNEQKIIRFSLGTQNPANERLIETVYTTGTQSVTLTAPFIATKFTVNGQPYDGKNAIAGNRETTITLEYQSMSDKPITDTEIRVALSGDAFNSEKVRASAGFYDSATDSIIWTKNEWDALGIIQPGQSGRLTFSLTPLAITNKGTLDMNISVSGVLFGGKQETLDSATTAKIAISTDLQLLAKTLYHSGPLQNTGPMPMKVGKETTFTIIWQLSNSTNPTTGVVLKTTLPTGIVWKNVVSPLAQAGEISYNSITREVVWSPNDVPVGKTAKSIAFKLAVTPTKGQGGGVVNLTNDIIIVGTDTVTQTPISDKKRFSTSVLINDTSPVGADGKVLP